MHQLTRKQFKLHPLTAGEIWLLLAHLFISLAFWIVYEYDITTIDDLKSLVNAYYFVLPFVVVGVFFRSLRNFKFFLVWTIIGVGQIVIFLLVRDNPAFDFPRRTAFSALKALFPTLVVFQVCRLILLKTQNRELIVTMRKGRLSMWEEDDNRNTTWVEVFFSLLLMATIVTFAVI